MGPADKPLGPVHVWPCCDAIDHDIDNLDECVCGPNVQFIGDDGEAMAVPLVTHHSLDGREREETDPPTSPPPS